MLKRARRLFLIVTWQTAVIASLAVASTALCLQFNIIAEFPLTLIATSIVFPIVFSIGGAYKRRETALREYAAIKGYLRAIYFAGRDWLANPKPQNVTKLRDIIEDMFTNIRMMFSKPVDSFAANEQAIYDDFSKISLYIKEELRGEGLASGECSRTNQYLQKMMISFESLKHIYQYRTPRTLRAFSSLFIVVLPIVYGPHFAAKAADMTLGLEYLTPVLLSMILVSLENIQEHLENPFDQVGEDDITFNVEKFIDNLNHN